MMIRRLHNSLFSFGHWHLNSLVLAFGRVPIAGNFAWWMFGEWQRLSPD